MSTPAETYEHWFVPGLFAPLATAFVDCVKPRPGARVLDVACGTGIVARRIVPIVGPRGKVVGLDLNPGMLAVASPAAEREGVTIEWREGNAQALPFPDGSFDLVLCQQGLQFVPDKPAAVARMHQVLTPDGCAAVAVWKGLHHHQFYKVLHEATMREIGSPAIQAPFSLGDPDELRAFFVDAGFGDVLVETVTITASFPNPEQFVELQISSAAAAIPALQALDDQARANLMEAIRADMEEPVRVSTVNGHLQFPMHALVVRAYRQ